MIEVEFLRRLPPARRAAILARSAAASAGLREAAVEILTRLTDDPEGELRREYGPLRPRLTPADFKVSAEEVEAAYRALSPDFLAALKKAAASIHKFHAAQLERSSWFDEFAPGLLAGRLTRPLERVGVYIPGGLAPYPSSALMNIIPAKAAGVGEIAAASPPGPNFTIRPEILAAAHLAGADAIYKLGGAWAVGCLAHGLAGLPRVDKIVGPGSAWVTSAKLAVFGQVDIDLPAGPSEGFIIADGQAPAEWLAWDLLAQLEHDPMSAAVLVSVDENLARLVAAEISRLLPGLDRRDIVSEALVGGAAILVAENLNEAFDFANLYAPEHLQLSLAEPMSHLGKVRHAGSVFLGAHAPIAGGDYATGPNHVLPTGGAARMFSGLSVDSFLKKITFQHLTPEAARDILPAAAALARAEGLTAHARSLEIRLT
ncbi:MAG: histidinol dehydrogenase [Deltaproteobacteria bacterium]|nr:histidinol dehydrogenase [Deltaproteobacteria bacterium]